MSKTIRNGTKDLDEKKNGKKLRRERERRSRRLENEFQKLRGEIDYELAEKLDWDIEEE